MSEPTCNCKDYGNELIELTKAVQALVKLVSVLDRKVTAALSGQATFEVL